MEIISGWLQGVRCVPTKVCGKRPSPLEISLIVIHSITLPPGCFGGPHIDELFTLTLKGRDHPYFVPLEGVELSTHLFIARTGRITQYVSFLDRAYHAGRSSYQGKAECNNFGIGIELEGTDYSSFAKEQYAALDECIFAINKAYPATKGRIAGHNEVAPGRKSDPGACFDFKRYRA